MQLKCIRKPKGKASVVFVHGILSSGEACWTHKNGAYWPELLKKEKALGALGIYVYTYQTGIFSGDYRVSDVVDDLKERMRVNGIYESERIIFVCHSLGGIVVRKFLVERAIDFIEKNTMIGLFLLASPSLGSHYADWLSPLAKLFGHSQADALRFVGDNTWLSDLDKEFQNLKEGEKLKIVGKELIEDKFIVLKRLFKTQVVEAFAGARYFGEQYKVTKSDHHSIAKPADKDAIQHELLCKFIKSTLSVAQPSTAQSEPQNRLRAANTSRAANERIIYDSVGRNVAYDFTGMEYYLYISDNKVNMLYPQISGVNIGVLKRNLKSEREVETNSDRFLRLAAVSRHISEHEKLGTIDQPNTWIKDTQSAQIVCLSQNDKVVFFIGESSKGTRFALGGSTVNLVAKAPPKKIGYGYSFLPYLLRSMEKMERILEERHEPDGESFNEIIAKKDESKWMDFISLALRSSSEPPIKIKFLVKKLLEGEHKRDHARTVLATPLYVAMAD